MAADEGVQAYHILGWVVAGAGVAVNLFWNWKNREHTNEMALSIRKDQYQRDTWARLRTRIEDRLDELVEAVVGAPAQMRAIEGSPTSFLDILNIHLVNAQDALARELAAAEKSQDCNVMFWHRAQWGIEHGDETSWDILLAGFSAARNVEDLEQQIRELISLKPHVLEISDAVGDLIRRQDEVLRPST